MSSQPCSPRWATRRRPERPTFGDRLAKVAVALGLPPMPWQQLAFDVGGELVEHPRTGLLVPAYDKILLTVPRQCGKTTAILSWEIDRALNWGRPQNIVYSMQTGKDGRNKLLDDQLPIIEASPLAAALGPKGSDGNRKGVRRVNGNEALRFVTGSYLTLLASGKSAGHGRTTDLGVMDEVWADVDNTREGALQPSQITRDDSQLLICSTQGTEASLYLNSLTDAGRIAVEEDTGFGLCMVEFSAREDMDPGDERTWEFCMPALDHTISRQKVTKLYAQAKAEGKVGEFRRHYLNQRTASDERVIPVSVWEQVCRPNVKADGRVFFAVDANPERSSASIAVCDSVGHLEIVEQDDGIGWAVPRAEQLARKWGSVVALDPSGPASGFADELRQRGTNVIEYAGRDLARACAAFYDACAEGEVKIRKHSGLDAAVAAAVKRQSADSWTWARKDTTADISPLVAATLALYASKRGVDPTTQVF